MSYQALARTWRPRTFASLVGQDHVKQGLTNALDRDRLHHAFLFTGTRGVGKTTIARIFAKAINCEQGVSSEPCGECGSCQEIDAGRFIDLIEVDAASRTGVDDTRDLLENVQYAPTRGRYKVYIIDEVHMFSKSSFNALLKTLEEPPPHVKFLLATTDPQKIPVTVLSRCLQFHLRPIAQDEIARYLQEVVAAESIASTPAALALIARAATGSMRDALSLLDQAIAYAGGELTDEQVRQMLGLAGGPGLSAVLEALEAHDGPRLMQLVTELSEQTPDFAQLLEELLRLIHAVAVSQVVPQAVDQQDDEQRQVAMLAGQIAPETLQLYYQSGLIGRRDLPLAPDPRTGFEMILLRMLSFRPADAPSEPHKKAPLPTEDKPTSPQKVAETAPPWNTSDKPTETPPKIATAPETSLAPANKAETTLPDNDADWHQIIDQLGLGGMALELARNLVLRLNGDGKLLLMVSAATAGLMTERAKKQLEEAIAGHFGKTLKLEFKVSKEELDTPARQTRRAETERQLAADHAIEHDPQVQALQGRFDGQIEAGSTHPIANHDREDAK